MIRLFDLVVGGLDLPRELDALFELIEHAELDAHLCDLAFFYRQSVRHQGGKMKDEDRY